MTMTPEQRHPTPERSPLRKPLTVAAVVASLALGGAAGALLDARADAPETRVTEVTVGWADLVESVSPAVVSVLSTREQAQRGPMTPGQLLPESPGGESPMERFMRRFFGEEFEGPQPDPGQPPLQGLGSGFLIAEDGHIVTNHHVVHGAERIEVVLQDGRSFEAELIGSDQHTDLALIRIEAGEELPHVRFGDSDAMRVGDPIAAVGNPFGLGGTVTAGIVSAMGRDIGAGPYDDFLQIDAAINRGNSGGPTFNLAGEVIGVNSAIFSPTGVHIGIGFAIPSNLAQEVVQELREHGEIERGWLGVHVQDMDEELARALGLEEQQGALVAQVVPDSPAAEVGLRQGDVIVAFDDEAVETMRDLPRLVADRSPGSSAEVTVWRDGEEQTLTVALGRLPTRDEMAAVTPDPEPELPEAPQLGMRLVPLTPEVRGAYEVPPETEGVLVLEVAPGSAAAARGIQEGDVIVEVGGRPVSESSEVAEGLEEAAEAGEESALLLVQRAGEQHFIALPLAAG